VHERKSEQVEPTPPARVGGSRIVSCQPDAPDLVHRARLDENACSGPEQECAQHRVLLELGEIAGHHDRNALFVPGGLIESGDPATERLGSSRDMPRFFIQVEAEGS
jgi:hypothetical protein